MTQRHLPVTLLLAALLLAACSPAAAPAPTAAPAAGQPVAVDATSLALPTRAPESLPAACAPTPPDALGPFYKPGAPQRTAVGSGYTLNGVIRSAADCAPIHGAQIEVWMAGPTGEYLDDFRATLFAGDDGSYTFESHFPPPYSGRPPHIHLMVSAPGYETLVTQHYPAEGITQAVFEVVLTPSP